MISKAERTRQLIARFKPSPSGIGMFYFEGMELSVQQMRDIGEFIRYTDTPEYPYWLKNRLTEMEE